jgi:hypothetical protein
MHSLSFPTRLYSNLRFFWPPVKMWAKIVFRDVETIFNIIMQNTFTCTLHKYYHVLTWQNENRNQENAVEFLTSNGVMMSVSSTLSSTVSVLFCSVLSSVRCSPVPYVAELLTFCDAVSATSNVWLRIRWCVEASRIEILLPLSARDYGHKLLLLQRNIKENTKNKT